MAAEMGLSPELLETEASPPDKRLDVPVLTSACLMERLRARCGQHKSWSDSVKSMKITLMNDKRHYSEALEKSNLQNCLDKLHRAMKILNQQSLIERLELICRQLGMLFTPPTSTDNHMVLSSDMFKVIIVLEGQNGIKDVRVGHQENPVTCEDLIEVLSKGDFDEFIRHLEGLLSIYSINGDKKQKTKGYLALSSLESDLNLLAQLQNSINGVANYIHKSPLGILLPRRGGHPMKLIYYVSPYDLLCKRTRTSYPMTVEAITENDLGHSVTVCMEPCVTNSKLQTMPLMSVKTNSEGKSLPSFQGLNNINSYSLSASFVLVLPQPIPIATSVIRAIQDITGLDVICGEEQSLLSLLLQHGSDGRISDSRELLVTLPDQHHVYFLNMSGNCCLGQPGALVTKIPFTHPTSVPNVLNLLRQQLMFNSVCQSLIRPAAKKDYKSSLVFEVTALSLQYLSVMFEHPLHDSMITVEFDLSDVTSGKCHVCTHNRDGAVCSDDVVSRAFQRCFSIPVTLRTVIDKVREQIRLLQPPVPIPKTFCKPRWKYTLKRTPVKKSVTCATNINMNHNNTVSVPQTINPVKNLTQPPPPPYPSIENWAQQGSHLNMTKYNVAVPPLNPTFMEPPAPSEDPIEKQPANPLLATLLDAGSPTPPEPVAPATPNESPMLSKLLEENTSVATPNASPFSAPNPTKKRLTKRKSSKDMMAGRSPKHRLSDADVSERMSGLGSERYGQGIAEKNIDLDSSGGSYSESEPMRPSSVNSIGSVGQSSTGSVIDLTDIGESHVKKLENSLDSIMQKESRPGMLNMNVAGMNVNSQMGIPDMMDIQNMQFNDFHHNQNLNQMLNDGGGGRDFQPPLPPWDPRQTPPIPTSRNSPHHGIVPKNEKISTSLEELLHSGPGGREQEGPNMLHMRHNSQSAATRRHSLKRQNSLGRMSFESMSAGGTSPDVFSPNITSPGHHPLSGMFPISSSPNHHNLVSPINFPGMSPTQQMLTSPTNPAFSMANVKVEPNMSFDAKVEKLDKSGISIANQGVNSSTSNISFSNISSIARVCVNSIPHVVPSSGGKPSLSALKAQLEMKNDINLSGGSVTQVKNEVKVEDESLSFNGPNSGGNTPLLKIKLRQYDSISPPEMGDSKPRSSTFDFHSDDDEDFNLPLVEKITVVSASPTRLQISNKSTIASFNKFNKSEKFKRKEREKELKKSVSTDSGKRKRDKEESKKERKKKKVSNSSYSVENEMAVYKSTTVDVEGVDENNKYKPMPKLKIIKSGIKMSIENSSVLKVKEVKPDVQVKDLKVKVDKLDKEAVVKIEKVEKISSSKKVEKDKSEPVKSFKYNKEVNDVKEIKYKEKSLDVKPCVSVARTSSASDEGIFDRINAMKTESMHKIESEVSDKKNSDSPVNHTVDSSSSKRTSSSSNSSKSQKSHKSSSQRSNSSTKSGSKMSRTPTIKLKPIVVPHSTSSPSTTSVKTPTTPTTPKSITQSTTSTTIGKIGAVSLATSGSQKQLTTSSKSPQGQSSNKSSNSSNKGSSSSASGGQSKLSGNLQKSVQIQGSNSGKNSPVPTNKPGHSRSASVSSLTSTSSSSKEKGLNKSLSTSSSRTSSPLSEREKSKSGSRSSSGRDRDRDKSTSSSKNSVPVTTVITQETAASVLSFLNPKHNKIASLPPIPKLSSTSSNQKATTPTTSTSIPIVSPTVSTPTSTMPNFKFGKNSNNTQSNFNKGPNTNFNSNPNKSGHNVNNTSNSSTTKGNNSFNKGNNPGNHSSNNRPSNLTVSGNTTNSNKVGNNSPSSYSQQKNSNQYNKSNNNNTSNSSPGFRNQNNNPTGNNNSFQNRNNSNQMQNRATNQGNSFTYKGNNSPNVSNQNNFRGVNSNSGNRVNTVANPAHRSPTVNTNSPAASTVAYSRGGNSTPNAPKGPGPPVPPGHTRASITPPTDDNVKGKITPAQTTPPSGTARGRKGSLSAVIDKLTCKATVPTAGDAADATTTDTQKGDEKVIINESPASPEPESSNTNKSSEEKVVIFEAPASPEPEIPNALRTAGVDEIQTKGGGIVSIPLDEPYSETASNCKYSGDKTVQGDKPPVHQGRNSSSAPKTPKIIPLNSQKDKSSAVKKDKLKSNSISRQNSSNSLLQNGEISDNHLQQVNSKCRPHSRENSPFVEPNRSRTSTPVDLNKIMKSSSCDKNKDMTSNSCKVRTPNSISEKNQFDNSGQENDENFMGRTCKSRSISNSKAISYPNSPASSPENGLIIDCPSSPRLLQNKTNSPQCNSVSENRTSPNFLKSRSSSSNKLKSSPLESPLGKDNSDSVANSPCFLDDDDLMDEALGLGN